MNVVAVIQARVGSSRLPGKVMYPLADEPVLVHILRRVRCADRPTDVVVATSTEDQDAVVAREAERRDAAVFRGSESDVLGRMYRAAEEADADVVVRICADNPLLSPAYVDAVVERVVDSDVDYATNNLDRTVPVGLDVEAFTFESFSRVESAADRDDEREHVTVHYKENPDQFTTANVRSEAVFSAESLQNRDDLRLTLDTPPDYELHRAVYASVEQSETGIVPLADAIEYIDHLGLDEWNSDVIQRGGSG